MDTTKNVAKSHASSTTFIPNIFKTNSTKSTIVSAADPFISHESAKEFCSMMATDDKLPTYLAHYKQFTDNVLDISDSIFDDFAKVHNEREWQFREDEHKEDERLQKQRESEIKVSNSLDNKVTNILKLHRYYIKRSCPVKIPFKSTLNHAQHEFYVRSFLKFQLRPPLNSIEKKEHNDFMSLQEVVYNEQSCLMNFSYRVAQLALNHYNEVPAYINNYISQYVEHRCQRAFSYPERYKSEVDVPLKPQTTSPVTYEWQHNGHLLSLGNVPWLCLPNPHVQTSLPRDESIASSRPPDPDHDYDCEEFVYKCPVSEDPNAVFLARRHGASFVLSASAFCALADNQEATFEKDWNIPVVINNVKDGDSERRIVFIDKPLVRKSWTPLQKKKTFYKNSARASLTKEQRRYPFKMQLPLTASSSASGERDSRLVNYDSDIFTTDDESECADQFGQKKSLNETMSSGSSDIVFSDLMMSDDDLEPLTSSPTANRSSPIANNSPTIPYKEETPKSPPYKSKDFRAVPPPSQFVPQKRTQSKSNKGKKAKNIDRNDQNEKLKDSGLLADILGSQETLLRGPELVKTDKSPLKDGKVFSITDGLLSSQAPPKNKLKPWSKTIQTNWNDSKVKDAPSSGDTNYHYQLFTLHTRQDAPMVTADKPDPVKVIVRHSVHGLTRFKKKKNSGAAYILFPKLENQIYFGCEVNSKSEIARQWAALAVRPNTFLLQLRICVESGSVAMSEHRSLDSILKEGKLPHIDFDPQAPLAFFAAVTSALRRVGSGTYLLHHSAKLGPFAKLYAAITDKGVYENELDLHASFSEGVLTSTEFKTAPWLAIDTHVFSPFHLVHKKIPGTFPMENTTKLGRKERKFRRQRAKNKIEM